MRQKKLFALIATCTLCFGLIFLFLIRPNMNMHSSLGITVPGISKQGNQGVTVVSSQQIAIPVQKEMIDWEKSLAQETRELVISGHTELEEVKELVSKETRGLESKARNAYIDHRIEISRTLMKIAVHAMDAEMKQIGQGSSEHISEQIRDEQRVGFDKQFTEKKNMLIEKYFTETITSQRESKDTTVDRT